MLENIRFSLNVILPIFIYLGIGVLFRELKLLPEGFVKGANKFVFNVLFPCKVFYSIYKTQIDEMNLNYVLAGVIALVALFILLMVFIPRIVKRQDRKGVIVQAIYRGNFNGFVIPLCEATYGVAGAAYASVLASVIVPFLNIFGVVCLAPFDKEAKVDFKRVLVKIITNAQVVACILAIIITLVNLELPTIVIEPIRRIQNITTPFSIFVIGAGIDVRKLKDDLKLVSLLTSIRLVLLPLIFVPIFVLLGFRGAELVSLAMMFAVPSSASGVANAYMFHGDSDLANKVVLFTSILCVLTIAIMLFILKSFMLI